MVKGLTTYLVEPDHGMWASGRKTRGASSSEKGQVRKEMGMNGRLTRLAPPRIRAETKWLGWFSGVEDSPAGRLWRGRGAGLCRGGRNRPPTPPRRQPRTTTVAPARGTPSPLSFRRRFARRRRRRQAGRSQPTIRNLPAPILNE